MFVHRIEWITEFAVDLIIPTQKPQGLGFNVVVDNTRNENFSRLP